ncbi:MAG: hypothetical protein Ta2A_10800 [Treponemataceae bacterium]|nr:MAG: hypothetical protein Ta2A_10800 [Treponemataceae bacterium]
MLRRYMQAGWTVSHQTGSHVRVKKGHLSETISMHKELKKGAEQPF